MRTFKNYIAVFMKNTLLIILILISLFSCSDDNQNQLNVDVSKINSDVKIKRFEQIFYTAKPTDLPKIKKEFRFLFPHDIDSVWVKKMQDKDEQELFAATQKKYPNLTNVKSGLDDLFKHIKYYYPKFKEPTVITLNSNVGYGQRVVYADTILFVSLDVFLGSDSEIYQDYPAYLKNNFTTKQLFVSTGKELVQPIIFPTKDRSFLSRIIQEGKKLYALDAFLPKMDDANKMGYSPEQLAWVETNENMVWSYFVDKEMLYKTDNSLNKRFIEEAPFSKFYLDIDNDSPGKVGAWLGWQIVRSYMKHHKEVGLTDLMKIENEEIFKKSKYKPRR